jgi:hypothetical protein
MTFADTFKAIPDQFLDLLGVTQELILTNASTVAATAKSFTPPVNMIPFADELPDPSSVSDSLFAFADKVLTSQKDFSHKLLDIYAPAKPAPAPAKATAVKSA